MSFAREYHYLGQNKAQVILNIQLCAFSEKAHQPLTNTKPLNRLRTVLQRY